MWKNNSIPLFVLAFVGLIIFTLLKVLKGVPEAIIALGTLLLLVRCWRLAARFFGTSGMYRNTKRLWVTGMMSASLPFLLYPSPQLLLSLIFIWVSLESVRLLQVRKHVQGTLFMLLGINFKWLVIVAVLFIMAMAANPTVSGNTYSPTKMNAPQ